MPRTHQQVVEAVESLLFDAMISANMEELYNLVHPDHVLVNENGQTFHGIKKLEINKPDILRIKSIEIVERTITLFNNVAIVTSDEKRTGDFWSMHFEREYRMTRTWKFDGRSWRLINTVAVLI